MSDILSGSGESTGYGSKFSKAFWEFTDAFASASQHGTDACIDDLVTSLRLLEKVGKGPDFHRGCQKLFLVIQEAQNLRTNRGRAARLKAKGSNTASRLEIWNDGILK